MESSPYPGVDTLFKAMKRNLERIPNKPWLGTRNGDKYDWLTWKECMDIAHNLSYGIMELGLCPEIEAEDRTWRFMGIQSKNRKEWVLTHAADIHQTITTVALYDTLGPDATKFVLDQTQMATLAVSQDYVSKLAEMKKKDDTGKMQYLKNLIVFENGITDQEKAQCEEAGLTLYTLEEVVFKGRESQNKTFNEPKPNDCFAFSYTSGTTGDPKGVKLTHKMGIMSASAVNVRCGNL